MNTLDKVYDLTIDIKNIDVKYNSYAKFFDDDRETSVIRIKLLNDKTPMNLENCIVEAYFILADNTYHNEACKIINSSEGVVELQLCQKCLVKGENIVRLSILKDNEISNTPVITYEVRKGLYSDNPSFNDDPLTPILSQMLLDIKVTKVNQIELQERYEKSLPKIEGKIKEVDNAIDRVNNAIASGTQDLEVKDARVGKNGKSYAKLGDRLDEVDSQLEHKANKKDLPYVDVKLYGAKGDGITDDTEAIKNALLKNSNLYFPNGTYIISESITLSKSTNIKGGGQTLNWGVTGGAIIKGTHDDYIFKCSWGNQNNFYKINFDGKGIHTPCSSFISECGFRGDIGIYHSRVTTIDRCVFANCSTAGIYKMIDSKILNSFFYSNEIGIYAYDSNDNIIQGNKIEWNELGIKFDTNVYNLVQGNIFDRQTTYGIEAVNGAYLSIKNNQFERNLINHIKLNNSNCNIVGNGFYHKQINDDGTGDLLPTDALFIDSVNRCLIEGNTIVGKKMFNATYSSVSGLITTNNTINGSSDNPKWVNIGTITVDTGKTSELRYSWSSLDFLNANGYDVFIRGWRASDGNYTYYNNLSIHAHSNNGLFVSVTNSTSTSKTYTVYVLLEHKQWTKR